MQPSSTTSPSPFCRGASALSFLLPALLIAGCGTHGSDGLNYGTVLTDVGTHVILESYVDLSVQCGLLDAAVTTFANSPTTGSLTDARNAWKAAREPWELSEAYLMGPVATKGLAAAIDAWPTDIAGVDTVLLRNDSLSRESVRVLAANVRGFHAIEYLLWGVGGVKDVGDFTAKEREYLKALSADLKADADTLRASWDPAQGNYLAAFKGGNPRTTSQALVNGMIALCGAVDSQDVSPPYASVPPNPALEESRFSGNSTVDFTNAIRGLRNVYLGSYQTFTGSGIRFLVAQRNPALADSVTAAIDIAVAAVGNLTPTFITADPDSVQSALVAVRRIHSKLLNNVLPLLAR